MIAWLQNILIGKSALLDQLKCQETRVMYLQMYQNAKKYHGVVACMYIFLSFKLYGGTLSGFLFCFVFSFLGRLGRAEWAGWADWTEWADLDRQHGNTVIEKPIYSGIKRGLFNLASF